MSKELRSLVLRSTTEAGLRTAVYDEKEYLVVPVVALVEGVVHAVNAKNPELVLAEEFGRFPSGWNGEPVMFNHPVVDGNPVSANDPAILEMYRIGQVFNTSVESNKLHMEAWLDRDRIRKVGGGAEQLLQTLEEGGTIEVSVGVFVNSERKEGIYNGKAYKSVWRDLVPDHLAFLELGSTGACSNKAGCGAGAKVHLITAEGYQVEGSMPEKDKKQEEEPKTLRERILSLLKFRSAAGEEDLSDRDLRQSLDKLLFSTEPAYAGIDAVFPADKLVVYAVYPEGQYQLYRRGYSISEGGDITLNDDRVEVEPVTRYEPVVAEGQPHECGCQKRKEVGESAHRAAEGHQTSQEGEVMHKNAERITALIANPKTPWTELDRTHLENQSDERLSALEAAANAPDPEPVKPEIKLEDLPQEWQDAINAQKNLKAAEQAKIVTQLKTAQSVFTEAELREMPLDQLKKIAALANQEIEETDFFGAAGTEPAPRSASNRVGYADAPRALFAKN